MIFLILLEIAGDFHIDIFLYCIYIIYIHTTFTFLHLHFISSHWAITFGIAKSFVDVVLSSSTKFSSFHCKKGQGNADVDFLKVKNDTTH